MKQTITNLFFFLVILALSGVSVALIKKDKSLNAKVYRLDGDSMKMDTRISKLELTQEIEKIRERMWRGVESRKAEKKCKCHRRKS